MVPILTCTVPELPCAATTRLRQASALKSRSFGSILTGRFIVTFLILIEPNHGRLAFVLAQQRDASAIPVDRFDRGKVIARRATMPIGEILVVGDCREQ